MKNIGDTSSPKLSTLNSTLYTNTIHKTMPRHLTRLCLLLTLFVMQSLTPAPPITIHMIGDSTMANKPISGNNQERGWGQMLSGFFSDDVRIQNYAVNGRSSLSFITEGRWQEVLDQLQPGDYVFIQFGHNDEKIKSEGRGTRPGTPEPAVCPDQWRGDVSFDTNLRRFVTEARERGGIPVLFDAIARRSFFENKDAADEDDLFGRGITLKAEGDSLVETHVITRADGHVDDYLEAPRRIASEMDVPFVGMNAISKRVIQQAGVEGSKDLFCWLPADVYPGYPKGREDNTHLRIQGARQLCRAAIDAIGEAVPALQPFIRKYDLVVAQDGSGDFFTIQEAINAVPDCNGEELRILIAPGTYHEKLVVPESKSHVTLVARTEGQVIISYDDYASRVSPITGRTLGTSGSATAYIYAPWFEAIGITFQNTASQQSFAQGGRGVGQAVACLVAGDCAVFRRCRFLGHQDTLYAYGRKSDPKTQAALQAAQSQQIPSDFQSRQYYEDCYIEGTVDYIFGWATAYFNRCELHSLADGYVTAAATPQGQQYGYVFNECHVTAEPGVHTYLGRPWRNYAQTVYLNCTLDACVQSAGWQAWPNKTTGLDGSTTALYAEYQSQGPGAATKKGQRVSWARQLTAAEAARYDIDRVLGGYDQWSPASRPQSVRMVLSELQRNPDCVSIDYNTQLKWNYTHGLLLQSMLQATQVYPELKAVVDPYVYHYCDTIIHADGSINRYKLTNYTLDHINPGKMLMLAYDRWPEQRFRQALDTLYTQLQSHPRTSEGGFWHKKAYPHQMWLDGIYMEAPYYCEYAKRFLRGKAQQQAFDDVVRQFTVVARHTLDPQNGLYRHAFDESCQMPWSDRVTGQAPHVWGRAVGWFTMAMVDVYSFLPEGHAGRDTLRQLLQPLCDTLLTLQQPSGAWQQVLDQTGRAGNYDETSCTAMFAYTLMRAARLGMLPQSYFQHGLDTWQRLTRRFVRDDFDAQGRPTGTISITRVCGVAGLGGTPYRSGDYDYYIHEIIRDNDPKAVGPYIMASLLAEGASL